jgi:hypothetical protein
MGLAGFCSIEKGYLPMTRLAPILVEISPGELWDKITILRIKIERITNAAKLTNVRTELTMLEAVAERAIVRSKELDTLVDRLRWVNESLWNAEDDIRRCERDQDFGPMFIELARSVYRTNDERGRIKRHINDLLGAMIVEEKQYENYG